MMPQMACWVHSRVLLRSDRGAVSFFTVAGSTLVVPHSSSMQAPATVTDISFHGDRNRHFNVCIIQFTSLPGNSNICAIKVYRYVWFAFQLSPKGAAIWISCFIAILTIIALWPVGIMFQQVRVLLNCKKIIPKFALYQVRNSIFLIRIDLTVDVTSAVQVFSPLLKDYSIFLPH